MEVFIRLFMKYLGYKPMEKLTLLDARTFILDKRRCGISASTCNFYNSCNTISFPLKVSCTSITLWFLLPFQWSFPSNSSCTKGPSTITSQYFTTSNVLISSQQNPVYNQMVFSGNVSLISFANTATSAWFAGCSGSPPLNVTPVI